MFSNPRAMEMRSPLQLAMIGVGDVARRDYLPHFGRIASLATVAMVISRNRARAEKTADEFGIPAVATDWRAAMDTQIDAVINLTPAPVHGEINWALARGGRHFYSEKPFAGDVAEGQRVRAAAEQSHAVVAAAPSVMVYPQVIRAAQILASGELGTIRSVRANATVSPPPWEGYIGDHAPFFSADVGPLSDMGVYPLHVITGLLGDVDEASAIAQRTRTAFTVDQGPFAGSVVPVGVEDNWQVLLSLASGPLVSLQVGFCITQPSSCDVEVCGERGSMAISLLDPSRPLTVFVDGVSRLEAVVHERSDGPDHVLGVREFLEAILSKREPVINTRHALHVIAVRQAIVSAARSGARTAVEAIN